MDEEQVKNSVSYFECIHCNQYFEPNNADFVAHYGDSWVFAVYCPYCQITSLQVVIIAESGGSEVVNELSEAEQVKFSTQICSDDVIDIHLFMRDYNGDLTFLLSE